jgi:hypothetical protein
VCVFADQCSFAHRCIHINGNQLISPVCLLSLTFAICVTILSDVRIATTTVHACNNKLTNNICIHQKKTSAVMIPNSKTTWGQDDCRTPHIEYVLCSYCLCSLLSPFLSPVKSNQLEAAELDDQVHSTFRTKLNGALKYFPVSARHRVSSLCEILCSLDVSGRERSTHMAPSLKRH